LEYTDLVLLDVKHINLAQHKKLTGKWNESVLQFAQYLDDIKKPIWLRYVFVPWRTDQEEALYERAKTLSQYKNIQRVEILPYHRLWEYKRKALGWKYALDGVNPPTKESIDHCKEIFEQYFPKVRIR
jgi:pyruvate formate lyase activating enzyme